MRSGNNYDRRMLTQKCELLPALASSYKQFFYSTDDRLITVEFTQGQSQICAINRPHLERSGILAAWDAHNRNHSWLRNGFNDL